MRFLFLVSIVLFVGACSHKHSHHHNHEGGHDHAKMEQDKACSGCAHHDKDHKGEACAECGAKGGAQKERGCCSDDKSCSTNTGSAEVCKAEASPIENNPKVLKNISQEEFSKVYTKNKTKIGQSCSAPAMKYCGKVTKDMMVSEGEMTCLWTKVFRVTRETLPELDGTPCAKMIKDFAKK